MPTWRRTKTTPAPATAQPLIASAALISQKAYRKIPDPKQWQTSAWDIYDRIGELRFAVGWLAQAVSRCRLYVGIPPDDGAGNPDRVEDPRITQPLEELDAGQAAGLLTRMAIHLQVPGESYLVGYDDPTTGARRWIAASGDEFITGTGRLTSVRLPDADEQLDLDPQRSTVIRIWRPHPRRAWWADSPTRGVLEPLQEILDLAAHTKAAVDSRLAGAGILEIPASATLPMARGDDTSHVNELHDDPHLAALAEAMVTPITNRDSAAAVVPILMRTPDEAVGKARHLTFATPLDAQILGLQEAAIRRVALGMDIPPEILLGQSDSNHWSQVGIEEQAVKLHVEPLATLICEALTDRYLRPALTALGIGDADRYVVWFDPSELVLRPNRAPEAIQLRELGAISGQVLRREVGFGEDDAPTAEERAERLLMRLAQAGVDPATVKPYLDALNIAIDAPAEPATPGADGTSGTPQPAVSPPASRPEIPATPGSPNNPALPASAAPDVGWMFRALELATVRALEIGGKRLLSGRNRHYRGAALAGKLTSAPWEIHAVVPTEGFDLDQVLGGAFNLVDLAFGDRPCVRDTVEQYVRALIVAGARHESRYLAAALERAGCLAEAA